MIIKILGHFAFIFGGIAIGYFLSEIINSEKFRRKRVRKENDKTRKKLFC